MENDFEMAPKNEQDLNIWKADASSGGVGTVWKHIWAGTHVGAIGSLNATVEVVFSSGEGLGEGVL